MLKKTITFEDYNGKTVTEDHYFNLSTAEVVEQQLSVEGGLSEQFTQIVKTGNPSAIMSTFKDIIRMSYGIRSEDGRRFIKSDALFKEFVESAAYDALFMELCTNATAAVEFAKAILPKGAVDNAEFAKLTNQAAQQVIEATSAKAVLPKDMTREELLAAYEAKLKSLPPVNAAVPGVTQISE